MEESDISHLVPKGLKPNSESLRLSQESRATSTPSKKQHKPVSLFSDISDISTIRNTSESSKTSTEHLSSLSSKVEEQVEGIESLSLTRSSKRSSHIYGRARKRTLSKGIKWKFFSAKHPESLYYKLISDMDEIDICILELMHEFSKNEKSATIKVLKFFIDICGYQDLEIASYLNLDEEFPISCRKLIKLMESDLISEDVLESHTYLFHETEKKKPDIFSKVAATVQDFMEKFIMSSYGRHILFSEFYHEYLFTFIFYMSQSVVRPVRHTAMVLVRVIFSSLSILYHDILEKIKQLETEELLQSEIEKQRIEGYLEYFFEILARECYIPDPWFVHQRSEMIDHMCSCISTLPQVYYDKCFRIFKKLIVDKFVNIRCKAVSALGNIIEKSKRNLKIREILILVYERLRDPSTKVIARAILVFTSALKRYNKFILSNEIIAISNFLYDEDCVLAKAAGSFLKAFFDVALSEQEEIIHKLVRLSGVSEIPEHGALLVEGFSEYDTVLKDFNILFKHFLDCPNRKESCAKELIQLIYYSLYQEMRGESFLQRKNSIKVFKNHGVEEKLTRIIMENLQKSFETYQNDIDVIKYILKILNLVDYDSSIFSYALHQVYLLKKCREIYLKNDDEHLFESISNLFSSLCKDYNNNCDERDVKTSVLNNLFEGLANFTENYSQEVTIDVKLDFHLLRVGKFYENFNLNKFFNWDNLYIKWKSNVICKGQLISCKQYLIWGLKELSEKHLSNADKTRILCFKNILSDFTKTLIMILSNHNKAENLKYEAFEGICSLYLSLSQIWKPYKELLEFRINVLENLKNQTKVLSDFFRVDILHSKTLDADTKQKYTKMWLFLIMNGMIDLLYVLPLFESYHLQSDRYARMIELFAGKLLEDSPSKLCDVVKATLFRLAFNIKDEKPQIDDPRVKNALELSVKIAKMKCMKKLTGNYLFNFVQECVRFASNNEYFVLLAILQPFTRLLTLNENKLCSQLLTKVISAEFESNEFVRTFRKKIQDDIENYKFSDEVSTSDAQAESFLERKRNVSKHHGNEIERFSQDESHSQQHIETEENISET